MGGLKDLLLKPGMRPRVITDCSQLIDSEVASKRGLSGMALKGGYGIFKKVKRNAVPDAVNWLLDDFADVLDGLYQRYLAQENRPATFEPFLVDKRSEMAEGMLQITDRRQEKSTNRAVRGAYKKLRPTAKKHVEEAAKGVGQLIDRYLAEAKAEAEA